MAQPRPRPRRRQPEPHLQPQPESEQPKPEPLAVLGMGAALVRHDAGLALWRQGSVFAVMARPLAVEHWNDIAEPGADEPGDRAGGERSPRRIASGYQQLDRDSEGWVGTGTLHLGDGCAAEFVDRWSVRGDVLRVARQVTVRGDAPGDSSPSWASTCPPPAAGTRCRFSRPGCCTGRPT
ncbi:MAG: hypothetical protein ACRDTQ_06145 [Micromonosporaceae bacterium]